LPSQNWASVTNWCLCLWRKKIKQRDEQYTISSEQNDEPELDEGDPYADYKIPDDLM